MSTADAADPKLALLRHTVATLAYRGGKTLRGSPPGFADYRVAPGTRSPVEILAHLGDLLDWARSQAQGKAVWHDSPPLPWDQEVERFFAALAALDAQLAAGVTATFQPERFFQGAIADALTHVGQLAMLRRLAGGPLRGENFSRADIAAGRVGPEQPAPGYEFD
ncbi:MAG: hypothetical protein JOZ15_20040 [Acidobacteria bacterium]|nr:hypothetical protein [Acidobacteriota bacterium]